MNIIFGGSVHAGKTGRTGTPCQEYKNFNHFYLNDIRKNTLRKPRVQSGQSCSENANVCILNARPY